MKEGWEMVKLGKVLKPSENWVSVAPTDSYKLLGMSLEGRGLFVREEKLGSEVSAKYLNKVVPGEFMYSRLFAWKGAFDKAAKEFEGCFVSDEYPAFQPDTDKLDIDYLTYFFQQKRVWLAVEQFCVGVTKASRNRFKEKFFLDFEIPLPPLTEQRRIAGQLAALKGKIDAVRALRGEQVREVERVKDTFLNGLFESLEIEFGAVSFTEIVNLKHGFQFRDFHFREKGIPVVKIGQIKPNGTLDLSNCSYVSENDAKQFTDFRIFKDDLLMALTGGTLGKVCYVKHDYGVVLQNYRVGKFEVKNEQVLDKDYLFFVLTSTYFLNQVFGKINQAAQPNIGKAEMEKTKIPLPSLTEQRRIVAEIQAFQTKMEQLKSAQAGQLAGLEGLFPAVLERAFRGEW